MISHLPGTYLGTGQPTTSFKIPRGTLILPSWFFLPWLPTKEIFLHHYNNMSPHPTTSLVGVKSIPAEHLALASFPAISYADFFTTRHSAPQASPEQWARAVFGSTPSLTQKIIWTVLLGIPLAAKRSPDTIAGWKVGGRGKDWVRLENRSRILRANLIVRVSQDDVSLLSVVRYENWFGAVWWPTLAVLHRYLVPRILSGAASRVESRAAKL